jgi:hypothetical protein
VQYVGPELLARLLTKVKTHIGYSVVHRFRELAGSFYGKEMEWHRVPGGKVCCVMDGGSARWDHDACDWLDQPYYVAELDCLLVSNEVFVEGKTHTYQHVLQPRGGILREPTRTEEWNPAVLADEDCDGRLFALPSVFSGKVAESLRLDSVTVKTHRIALLGRFVVFSVGQPTEVVLSKDIVAQLTAKMIGVARTPMLYQTVLRQANSLYSAVPNLPPSLLPRCVLYSTVLAMESMTSEEMDVLVHLYYAQGHMWGAHQEAITFTPRTSTSTRTIGLTATSFGVGYAVQTLAPMTLTAGPVAGTSAVAMHAVSALVLATPVAVVTVPPLAAVAAVVSLVTTAGWVLSEWLRPLHHEGRLAETYASTVPGELPLVAPSKVVLFEWQPTFKSIGKEYLAPRVEPRVGASVETTLARDPPVEEKPKMGLLGIGLQVVPTYFASGREEVVVAVTNRLTIPVPVPRKGIFEEARILMFRTADHKEYVAATSKKISITVATVDLWAKSYSAGRRAELRQVFLELESRNFKMEGTAKKVKAFVKVEKAVAVDAGLTRTEQKAPRIILAHDDQVLVMACPVLKVLYDKSHDFTMVKWRESGRPPGICPSGLSSEEQGRWVKEVMEILGPNMLSVESDGTKWDAHMQKEAMITGAAVATGHVRVYPNACRQVLTDIPKLKGTSRFGVKFAADIQMATGAPWTGLYNGKVNATMTNHTMMTGGGRLAFKDVAGHPKLGVKFFILVSGDDLVVLADREYMHEIFGTDDNKRIEAAWVKAGVDFGFTLKPKVHNEFVHVEFCSRYFYPALVDGTTLLMPGAKIGRTLVKCGWMVDSSDGVTLRSALLGQAIDNHHVPFVREFMAKMIELLNADRGRTPKKYAHMIHAAEKRDYAPETWAWMNERYGLTQTDLHDFTEQLAQVTSLPASFEWGRLGDVLARE